MLLLLLLIVLFLNLSAQAEPAFKLEAELDQGRVYRGQEVRPSVRLRNVSARSVEVSFMKPWTVIPEILDAGGKRLANAPSVVLDQIVVPETVVLAPQEALTLDSIPVVLEPAPGTDGLRAHWYESLPGQYSLRYTLTLPSGAQVTSNVVPITISVAGD